MSGVLSFIQTLYDIVNDTKCDELISWNTEGTGFYVHDKHRFESEILNDNVQFRTNNFASFHRQLNYHGILQDKTTKAFCNANFRRDQPELLINISRRKKAPTSNSRDSSFLFEGLSGTANSSSQFNPTDQRMNYLQLPGNFEFDSNFEVSTINTSDIVNGLSAFDVFSGVSENSGSQMNIVDQGTNLVQNPGNFEASTITTSETAGLFPFEDVSATANSRSQVNPMDQGINLLHPENFEDSTITTADLISCEDLKNADLDENMDVTVVIQNQSEPYQLNQMPATASASACIRFESGYSSEGSFSQPDQALVQQSTPQEAGVKMNPNWGSTEGGTLFCLRFNDELQFNNSEEYLWAIFDGTTRKKVVKYDEKEWLGKTPARAEPGTVPVVFETPTGDEVGKTQFTYVDKEEQEFRRFLQSTELQYSFFTRLAGQQGKLGGRGENVTENSDTFGLYEQGGKQQPVDVLQRLLYTAAQIGAEQFIRTLFSTSAGRIVFESYKNRTPLPEDIADANGHDEIAGYFRSITERFSEEDGISRTQSKYISWLELARAVKENEKSGPCEVNVNSWEGDPLETAYFGDAEGSSSDSDKERSDSDKECKGTVCVGSARGEEKERLEGEVPSEGEVFNGEPAPSDPLPLLKRLALENDRVDVTPSKNSLDLLTDQVPKPSWLQKYQLENEDEALARVLELSLLEHEENQAASTSSHGQKDQPTHTRQTDHRTSVTFLIQ